MGLLNKPDEQKPINFSPFSDYSKSIESQSIIPLQQLITTESTPANAKFVSVRLVFSSAGNSGTLYTVPKGKRFLLKTISLSIDNGAVGNLLFKIGFEDLTNTFYFLSGSQGGVNISCYNVVYNNVVIPEQMVSAVDLVGSTATYTANIEIFGYEF